MDPQLAIDLIEKLQQMPEDKQAHFKLTIVSLMHCYLEDDVSGALLLNYNNEERCAVISIGMMEEDIVECMQRVTELLTDPNSTHQVTLQ